MNREYETKRMKLVIADPAFAELAADFFLRNRTYLEAFEEKREEAFFLPEFQEIWLGIQRQKAEEGEWYSYYLFEKEDPDNLAGTLTISNIRQQNGGSAVISYRIDASKQGKGLGSEAAAEGTRIGFEELCLQQMTADVMPANLPSLRVLEKCGYEKEAYYKAYFKINGKWEDHIHMVLRRKKQ